MIGFKKQQFFLHNVKIIPAQLEKSLLHADILVTGQSKLSGHTVTTSRFAAFEASQDGLLEYTYDSLEKTPILRLLSVNTETTYALRVFQYRPPYLFTSDGLYRLEQQQQQQQLQKVSERLFQAVLDDQIFVQQVGNQLHFFDAAANFTCCDQQPVSSGRICVRPTETTDCFLKMSDARQRIRLATELPNFEELAHLLPFFGTFARNSSALPLFCFALFTVDQLLQAIEYAQQNALDFLWNTAVTPATACVGGFQQLPHKLARIVLDIDSPVHEIDRLLDGLEQLLEAPIQGCVHSSSGQLHVIINDTTRAQVSKYRELQIFKAGIWLLQQGLFLDRYSLSHEQFYFFPGIGPLSKNCQMPRLHQRNTRPAKASR